MKITNRNKQSYRLFLVALGVIALVLSIGAETLFRKQVFILSVHSFFVAGFAILLFLVLSWYFEKYCWKWPIFRHLGVVDFPDLSGRWVGFLTSSYRRNEQNVVIPMSLEISQNASSVSVRAKFERSQSDSVIAEFQEIEGRTYLYYIYDNSMIKLSHRRHSAKDRGVVVLEYCADDQKKQLKGSYFNDVKPHANHGEIEVLYSGPKLVET